MGQKTIEPSRLHGSVQVPPSKSMAHRAIVCASLAQGRSVVANVDYSDDIRATMQGMRALGARIAQAGDTLTIDGVGQAGKPPAAPVIDCGESGSTLRFLIPVALCFGGARFVGRGNLGKRPLTAYTEIFDEQGITYETKGPLLDFTVKGQLKPGRFQLRGDVSSQFISGLLFALPRLEGDSQIEITTALESKNYVDMTLSALASFGIEVHNDAYRRFAVPGRQTYRAHDDHVEGDYSQAAFFLCAGALGSSVQVGGLKRDTLQGDSEVLAILRRMGADVMWENGLAVCQAEQLTATDIDASQCPDIIPVVAATAALCKGTTHIRHAGRLRIKECDRLHAVCSELAKLGADITEHEDSMTICGKQALTGGTVWSHKDHRIAMMLAIAATRARGAVTIEDWECVSKSYPHFFDDYAKLGGVCR